MSESPHLVKNLVAMLRENGYDAHGFRHKNGLAGVSVEFSASGKNFSVGKLFEDSGTPEKSYDHIIWAVERKKEAVLSGLE